MFHFIHYLFSSYKRISVSPTDTLSYTDSSDNSETSNTYGSTLVCPIASNLDNHFNNNSPFFISLDEDSLAFDLLPQQQNDLDNRSYSQTTELKNTIQELVDIFQKYDSDSECSDSEIIESFANSKDCGESVLSSSYKPSNHGTIVDYDPQIAKQPFLFRRTFDVLTTIPNNGVGIDLNGSNSQGLLCGYLALAGGLYQLDINIFDFIYSVLDIDIDTIAVLETLRLNPSLKNVQEYQRKFGKLLFDFSTGDLAMTWFKDQVYDFDFLGEGAAVESAESSFSQSTFADRERLVVLMNNLTEGLIPVYINDESRDVLDSHIRLINPNNYHWECVNFKHLT